MKPKSTDPDPFYFMTIFISIQISFIPNATYNQGKVSKFLKLNEV